ncbi:MAG: hypothetical protein ACOYNS_14085 [Bacteroidota bacterium]
MNEFLYNLNSIYISAGLLVSLLMFMEFGYRLGKRNIARTKGTVNAQIIRIESSMLGMVALLIGFTFSLSLQRHEVRTQDVVSEANAIGTAFLRAELLPVQYRDSVQLLIREYVDLRLQDSQVSVSHAQQHREFVEKTHRLGADLWHLAKQAAAIDDSPVRTGLFIQSLNEVLDGFDQSEAELNIHVPEMVIFLLLMTFIITAAIFGYASGTEGHRPTIAANIFLVTIVLLTFLIIDLDRPRRGLIQVSQESMITLQRSLSGGN